MMSEPMGCETGIGRCLSEEWRPVPSFHGYLVSSLGNIRHDRPNAKALKGSLDKDGYRRVWLRGCTLRVHKIVCEAFHGPKPTGYECAHLDGDKTNNAASNLKWCTPKENNGHKIIHGTHQDNRGAKHPRARLTEDQVLAIRSAVGVSTRALAYEFGVSQSHVVRLRTGQRWSASHGADSRLHHTATIAIAGMAHV